MSWEHGARQPRPSAPAPRVPRTPLLGLWQCHPGAFDHELLLVAQMSWANLRAAFPTLSPAQLHRLLTQYQLASAVGPMSAWEPGAQDSPEAFKSGEPPLGHELEALCAVMGQKELPGGLPAGACRALGTFILGHLPLGTSCPVPHLGTWRPSQSGVRVVRAHRP